MCILIIKKITMLKTKHYKNKTLALIYRMPYIIVCSIKVISVWTDLELDMGMRNIHWKLVNKVVMYSFNWIRATFKVSPLDLKYIIGRSDEDSSLLLHA